MQSFRLVVRALCATDKKKDFEQALAFLSKMRDLELPLDGVCLAAIHKSSHCTDEHHTKLPMTVNGCI